MTAKWLEWARNLQAIAQCGLTYTQSEYEIERYELPNLLALNSYIRGVLGEGAAASVRSDPQAKTLGEYLRAKKIDVPESIVNQ